MQRLRGPAGAATSSPPAAPWRRRARACSNGCGGTPRAQQQLRVCASAAGGGGPTEDEQQESLREARRRLTRVFYGASAAPQHTSSSSTHSSQRPQPRQLEGARVECLPLWRVEWAVLPGMQEILHVLAPHYLHMFEAVFSRPRPWVFGHLYLPGGSRSLGSPSHALASGSHAPLIGVLMQVTRAVRLRDGKLLVLATALGRFRVVRAVRELPFSEADVELLEDVEVLESFGEAATAALMQSAASDEVSVAALMAASNAAAREAAAAAAWAWLRGYELRVALQQEWPGPGPCEGESDAEAYFLVQQLAEQGVAEVLPLPGGGMVIGRVDLQEVAAAAGAAAQAALQRAAAQLTGEQQQEQQQQQDAGGSALSSSEGADIITSLNTTVQRGMAIQAPEWQELTASSSTSNSVTDVLLLEAAIWAELDVLAALSSRVKGRRHSLPFGLLQLRPPPPHPVMAAAAAASRSGLGSSSSSSGGSSPTPLAPPGDELASAAGDGPAAPASSSSAAGVSSGPSSSSSSSDGSSRDNTSSISSRSRLGPKQRQYALAASEGTDVHAEPLHPPLRRAAKLSWAAALATGEVAHDKGEQRQALLEATSLASRLRFVLAVLRKHKHVLAALAAVEDV